MRLQKNDRVSLGLVYNLAKLASPFDLPSFSVFAMFAGKVITALNKQGYEIHVCKIDNETPFDTKGDDAKAR